RDFHVTGVQTCALPILLDHRENTLAETLYTAVTPSQTLVVSSKDDSLLHVFDDGSVVLLSPYSTIHFDEDYGTGNRSLLLKGERSEERRVGKERRSR